MTRWIRFIAGCLLGLLFLALALAAALLAWLRPAPGEWSHAWPIGRWQVSLSVPALIRIGTHPLLLRALDARPLHGPWGTLTWHAGDGPGRWHVSCAPCRVPWRGAGSDALVLGRVELLAQRETQSVWHGEFTLGDAPHAVHGRFKSSFDAQGIRVALELPDTPLADAYLVLASVVPEAAHARIEGRVRLQAQWRWPQRELSVQPHIEGFVVSGLNTERLLTAAPRCEPPPSRGFGTWLPRAVVAAEDQRFYEHAGYDLREMSAAWSEGSDAARGASTLSQQLAKLLYTGDERSPARKLRELLYAVELDRTLGKARVLHLYIAIAPWGDGRCGAAEASRHYLHKRVDKLTPTEAAWLASLLHNPQREWEAYARGGEVNVQRVGWVIEHLRPMPAAQREALIDALPGWSPSSATARHPN